MRAVAGTRVREELFQRWWCRKYNRPRKDPLLQEYTIEELMIEFFEDAIEVDPSEEFPRDTREAGTFMYRTGDSVVDKWQADAASGNEVDFSEAFGPDGKGILDRVKIASRKRYRDSHGVSLSLDDREDER